MANAWPSQPHCALAEAEADTRMCAEGAWLTAAQIILGDRKTTGGTPIGRPFRLRQPAGKATTSTVDDPHPAA